MPKRLRTTVIISQYDRQKYRGAVEKLIGIIDGADQADCRYLIIDNQQEGDWSHAITDRIFHLGGENSAREFSAFDRGLAHAREYPFEEDLFLFVTDAFMAYGSEFLSLITGDAIQAAHGWGACLGWVDAYPDSVTFLGHEYREWVRSSFFFMPADRMSGIEPIARRVPSEDIFGGGPEKIFREDAPISSRLQRYLVDWLIDRGDGPEALEDQWHSKFELNEDTYPFFVAKALAILREQELSNRLRESGVPVCDFRLIPALKRSGRWESRGTPRPAEKLEWLGWRELGEAPMGRHFVDHFHCARSVVRGEEAEVQVRGWATVEAGPERVRLEIGNHASWEQACTLPRPDLAHADDEGECGFELCQSVSGLSVGSHEIRFRLLEAGTWLRLGEIRVEPRFEFRPSRVFVPELFEVGIPSPIELSGDVESDVEVQAVELTVGGEPLDGEAVLLSRGRGENGGLLYGVRASGDYEASEGLVQLPIQLAFSTRDGEVQTWDEVRSVRSGVAPSFSIDRWEVGRWSLPERRAFLRLEGQAALSGPETELVLSDSKGVIAVEALVGDWGSSLGLASFRIERPLDRASCGLYSMSLCLRENGEERELERREFFIEAEAPLLHVDGLSVERLRSQPGAPFLVRSSGWIRNDHLVDSLALLVDGTLVTGLGWSELRGDVPDHTGHPLVRSQGFDFATEIHDCGPGVHEVELVASGTNVAEAHYREQVVFPDTLAAGFRIVSADLEALDGKRVPDHFGEYGFRGFVDTDCRDVVARLFIDGECCDELPLAEGGKFHLRARPDRYGRHLVRVVFSVSGRDRFDSGDVELECRPLLLPRKASDTWGRFLEYFDLEARIEGGLSPEESLARLCAEPDAPSRHWLEMLEQLQPALQKGPAAEADALPIPEIEPEKPLKVLFCSWEAPYSRHGGGVHLMHLLRGLGRRHEITLVHTYGDDLALAEEARPHVSRIVSVPRHHAPLDYRGRGLLPPQYYHEFVPQLEQVIDRELSTGDYDLVNFESSIMRPIPLRRVPSLLAVHELEYTAYLSHLRERSEGRALHISEIAALLRFFWFNVVDLPNAFDALVTITPEDARDIRAFAPESRIFVNEAAADMSSVPGGQLDRKKTQRKEEPVFTFVANYRHPPNLRSATFLIEEIMPRIRQRIPGARLELAGPHAPDELVALGRDGDSFLGFVENLVPVYARSSVALLPIFTGTGMRIKAVEALGHGCPVIGTELGLRGVGQPKEEAYLLAESAEDFASAAIALVRDEKRLAKMGLAAASHVQDHLSSERLVRDRERVWQRIMDTESV